MQSQNNEGVAKNKQNQGAATSLKLYKVYISKLWWLYKLIDMERNVYIILPNLVILSHLLSFALFLFIFKFFISKLEIIY